MPHPSLFVYAIAVLLLGAMGLLHWWGLTTSFGKGDEAIYIVTAKALAEGEGYRILSQWGDPFQIAYPPLYPGLLALVWLMMPAFPANLLALKGLNLVFAGVAVVMTYQLLVRAYGAPPSRGWAAAALLGLSGPFFFLTDVAMSEMPFIAATTVALRYLEPLAADRQARSLKHLIAMGALAALPMMVRSAGVTVGAGVLAWFLLRREWKAAGLFSAALVAFNLPWQLWVAYISRTGAPLSFGYVGWIAENTDGLDPARLIGIALLNAQRIYQSIVSTVAPFCEHAAFHKLLGLVGAGGLLPGIMAGVAGIALLGYVRLAAKQLRIMHLYLVIYLGMILVFPWQPFRYIIVLVPFLLVAYVEGAFLALAVPVERWLRPLAIGTVAVALLMSGSFGAFRVLEYVRYQGFHDAQLVGESLSQHQDALALAAWSRTGMPQDAAWISECDGCTYLLTGKKALLYRDGAEPQPAARALFNERPTYVLINVFQTPGQQAFRKLVQTYAHRADLVFQGPAGRWSVYRLSSDWPVKAGP